MTHDVHLDLPDGVRLHLILFGEDHRWIFDHVLRVPGEARTVKLYNQTKLVVDYSRGVLADQAVLSMHVIVPDKLGQVYFAGVDISPGAKTYLEWTYERAGDLYRLRELCVGVNRRFSFAEEPALVRQITLPFPVPTEIRADYGRYEVPFRKAESGEFGAFRFPRTTARR